MLITMSHAEWSIEVHSLTNRQLLKGYRELRKLQTDIKECMDRQKGSAYKYYLGENAFLQLLDCERGIEAYENWLRKRNYIITKIK